MTAVAPEMAQPTTASILGIRDEDALIVEAIWGATQIGRTRPVYRAIVALALDPKKVDIELWSEAYAVWQGGDTIAAYVPLDERRKRNRLKRAAEQESERRYYDGLAEASHVAIWEVLQSRKARADRRAERQATKAMIASACLLTTTEACNQLRMSRHRFLRLRKGYGIEPVLSWGHGRPTSWYRPDDIAALAERREAAALAQALNEVRQWSERRLSLRSDEIDRTPFAALPALRLIRGGAA